jgi:cell division protein FtsN
MRDLNRIQQEQQYWLSRGQLTALAVTTLSVALLGFFVGLMVGRRTHPEPVAALSARLVEPEVEQDALMDLLARVEQAAARQTPQAAAASLSYPERLVSDDIAPPAVEPESEPVPESVAVEPASEPVPTPPPDEPLAAEGVTVFEPSTDGWSVQVAAYTFAGEADERVAILRAQDLDAWRAEALVKGRTWYRVRIGSFDDRDAAQAEARELAKTLGTDDLMIARIDR